MRKHWRERNKRWHQIVGERILLRREECGLSQYQLAVSVELKDKGTISRYESGTTVPSAHTLFRISKVLNCSMDYFYEPIREES